MSEVTIINISAYKFVHLAEERLPELKSELLEKAKSFNMKGTILLSTEGINLFLAAEPEIWPQYRAFLETYPEFLGLPYKESISNDKPFTRMLVRIKKEIISMGHADIQPEKHTAPHLPPEQLQQWYEQGKDMIILDTRNDYEVELGTFEDAMDLNIENFRQFPDAIDLLPESAKEMPIVTFCTGGIRCEKASEIMLRKGFKQVYQLDGGILNYFEKCGGEHYEGECFVFDKRVALDTNLQETNTRQCYACRAPLTPNQQSDDQKCPNCEQHVDG
ncbi:MAG: sulfurtransferase [Gammaproteobacteria bacterium]|nr:sulfurtransferase [Gammaproteobacteria bacterium]MCH9743603.1 sulfurtransferase [Gammaproteobacteria bacterium]